MTDQQQSTDLVTVTIDGVEIKAPRGEMLIQVADNAGIHIPRFCYHKHLSVAANCRMCMVEVEKAPKPLPACATPVADGMQVYTQSELALDAQKGTMEFLLINHPLDCPVCDQGGECELQDVAMTYGSDVSRFNERKRVVQDKDIGPLVSTDMTRCIHCTRCVRFGDEIAGISELGAVGRGEFMEIGTYVEKSLSSELSGNVIDLCPVGALNAKPSRMKARAWEMVESATISPHDSFGSHLSLHTLRNEVIRVVPREHPELNETWISDRDRFSYEGMYSDNRLLRVMRKHNQEWRTCDWSDAIESVSALLKQYQPEDIGFLASANQTNEDFFLLQKLARSLGIRNIDHRIHQSDFSHSQDDPVFPSLGMHINDVENQDVIVVIGADLRNEQPMLAHKVRQAARRGAKVVVINPQYTEWHMPLAAHETVKPQNWLSRLMQILSNLNQQSETKIPNALQEYLLPVDASLNEFINILCNAQNSCVLTGQLMVQHDQYTSLRAIASWIATLSGASFGNVSLASNAAGASLLGILPHRQIMGIPIEGEAGLNYRQMVESPRKVYLLLGIEAEWDTALPAATLNALHEAQAVIAIGSFVTDSMLEYCHWLLPVSCYAEVEGTKVNMEGRWQSCRKIVDTQDDVKDAWKIFRMIGSVMGLEDFDYMSIADVQADIQNHIDESFEFDSHISAVPAVDTASLSDDVIYRTSFMPIYSIDPLVRNATSLQKAQACEEAVAYINSADIEKHNLVAGKWVKVTQGNNSAILECVLDNNVLPGTVCIPRGLPRSEKLGAPNGPVELKNLSVS